jgi:transcriptional regulator with XRE-family HTH domain
VGRRRSLGLTQEGLAERVGWDRQAISRLENPTHSPSLDRVFILADALGVSLTELFKDFDQAERAV